MDSVFGSRSPRIGEGLHALRSIASPPVTVSIAALPTGSLPAVTIPAIALPTIGLPAATFGAMGIDTTTLVVLVVIAFLAGIGITAIGPGGVFTTVALAGLTALPASTVAGTVHVTFVFTGVLGSAVYFRSGELRGEGRTLTAVLSAASAVGAVGGALVNTSLSGNVFDLLLGGFCVAVGAIIAYRERRELGAAISLDPGTMSGKLTIGVIGFAIGVLGGLLGIGGPVIAVPALVVCGTPMLVALAAAQVQSIVLSGTATATYLAAGAVSPSLALLVGVPQLAGVVVGWRIAHRVPSRRLKAVLAVVLVAIGPLLAL